MNNNEIGFIGGVAKAGDIQRYGLVEASNKYWSEYKDHGVQKHVVKRRK